jgi:hypothetical protein
MKFVVYRGQKKITVDNAWVPDKSNFAQLLSDADDEIIIENLQLHQIRITSTRSVLFDEQFIESEELEKEIYDGINWSQETVN